MIPCGGPVLEDQGEWVRRSSELRRFALGNSVEIAHHGFADEMGAGGLRIAGRGQLAGHEKPDGAPLLGEFESPLKKGDRQIGEV